MEEEQEQHGFPILMVGVLAGAIGVVGMLFVFNAKPTDFRILRFNSTDFATLLAGFGGVVIGGVISWALAHQSAQVTRKMAVQTARDTLKRDSQQRISTEKAQAMSLIFKVQFVVNGLFTQRNYIWDALNRRNELCKVGAPLWGWVQPQVTGDVPSPTFAAEEFLPLVSATQFGLISDCQLLALRFNVIENSFRAYTSKREAMQELMAPYSKIGEPGGPVQTDIPADMKNVFDLRAMELEGLVQDIYVSVRKDLKEAYRILLALDKTFNDYFGKENFFSMQIDTDGQPI